MKPAGSFKTLDGVRYMFAPQQLDRKCTYCVFKDGQVRGCPEIGDLCKRERGVWVRADGLSKT